MKDIIKIIAKQRVYTKVQWKPGIDEPIDKPIEDAIDAAYQHGRNEVFRELQEMILTNSRMDLETINIAKGEPQ